MNLIVKIAEKKPKSEAQTRAGVAGVGAVGAGLGAGLGAGFGSDIAGMGARRFMERRLHKTKGLPYPAKKGLSERFATRLLKMKKVSPKGMKLPGDVIKRIYQAASRRGGVVGALAGAPALGALYYGLASRGRTQQLKKEKQQEIRRQAKLKKA